MNLVHDKDISNQCIYDGLVIQYNTINNLRVEKKSTGGTNCPLDLKIMLKSCL